MQELVSLLNMAEQVMKSTTFHYLVMWYLGSILIGCLPMPKPGGNKLYRILFHVTNVLAGNLKRVLVALKVPISIEIDFDKRANDSAI